MALDLVQLRYFRAVAEEGSMTGAARVLRVSQPTLTVAIRNLEQGLKTTLFHRARHGVTLTSTGQELLDHTREILAQLEMVEQRIHGLEAEEVGHFVIGAHASLASYFFPVFMRDFWKSESKIDYSIWNGASPEVWQRVLAREVHFGLVVNPRPHPDLVMVELFRDTHGIFARVEPQRPAAKARRARAGEKRPGAELAAVRARIRQGPVIFADRFDQSRELLRRLNVLGLAPPRLIICTDYELVKSLTLAGLGVGILPERVATYGHEGQIRRMHAELPFFDDKIKLIYRADLHRTRAAMTMKDALTQAGKALPPTIQTG